MRQYVERGGISSKVLYKQLKEKVLEEVIELDSNRETITGDDLQQIAMIKSRELGLNNFQVRLVLCSFLCCLCFQCDKK